MKVELIKEVTPERDSPWYEIRVDGMFKHGTFKEDVALKIYDIILKDPFYYDKKIEILKSQEVDVSLADNKKQINGK